MISQPDNTPDDSLALPTTGATDDTGAIHDSIPVPSQNLTSRQLPEFSLSSYDSIPAPSPDLPAASRQPPAASHLFLNLLLVIIVSLGVIRTLTLDRPTVSEQALSDASESIIQALAVTKSVYQPSMAVTPHIDAPTNGKSDLKDSFATSAATPKASRSGIDRIDQKKSPAKIKTAKTNPKKITTDSKDQPIRWDAQSATALNEWKSLTATTTTTAADWRRLGIARFLFNEPGALEALDHIRDPKYSKSKSSSPSIKRPGRRSETDTLEASAVTVRPDDEIAVWHALYSSQSIPKNRVDAMRTTLSQLHLGWFENVAFAQLYTKAGLRDKAWQAARAAGITADQVRFVENLRIATMALGIVGLGLLGLIGYGVVLQRLGAFRSPSGEAAKYSPGGLDQSGVADDVSYKPTDRRNAGSEQSIDAPSVDVPGAGRIATSKWLSQLPYSALMTAFLVYLLGQETVGVVFRLALFPLRTQLHTLPLEMRIRLSLLLQIIAYVPIVCIPLMVLRRRMQKISGVNLSVVLSLRELLAEPGFRLWNVVKALFAGTLGYILITPLVLLATLLSTWLFSRFHTPINPAGIEMMLARTSLTKALVLLIASVAAPCIEEIMFRGLLYRALRSRMSILSAALLSAAIFAGLHPTLPGGFLPIGAVGFGLALVYEWRGSLLPGMVLHGVYNGMITLTIFAVLGR